MGVMFGTDGVRGVANRELTAELALKLGRAGARVLKKLLPGAPLVVGRDTRISGDMLEAALTAGALSAGVDVLQVGVMPTPAVAFLTRNLAACGGAVISASHNPAPDNGIKFFGPSGFKLSDEMEEEIEGLVLQDEGSGELPVGGELGRVYRVSDAEERYLAFLKGAVPVDLTGLHIVVDCANGAAYRVAPRLLRELGAEVEAIFCHPDGVNINLHCGSTHIAALQQRVVAAGADLGLAFDGDADRLLAVDHTGAVVDGDQIMVIIAGYLQEKGFLARDTVVVTVMSNLGLHFALRNRGINIIETKVGDRYVLEEMQKSGAVFGGEQSGHIIYLEHSTTGDGLLTALLLLNVLQTRRKPLAELAAGMEKLPQLLVNVRVRDKQAVMQHPAVVEAIKECQRSLAGQGRVLVRPSGTEPLVRIMVEGRHRGELEGIANKLARVIQQASPV